MAVITAALNGAIYDGTNDSDAITVTATMLVTVRAGIGDDSILISPLSSTSSATAIFELYGGDGNDTITGDASVEIINGNVGDDIINGAGGSDNIQGGQGNDVVHGGTGNDTVQGNRGADTITGGEGDDNLQGGRGADNLTGDSDNDTIYGNLGDDLLTGSSGADIFVFTGVASADAALFSERDTINDFNRSEGDKIGLTAGVTFANILNHGSGHLSSGYVIEYTVKGLNHIITLPNINIVLTESDFVQL